MTHDQPVGVAGTPFTPWMTAQLLDELGASAPPSEAPTISVRSDLDALARTLGVDPRRVARVAERVRAVAAEHRLNDHVWYGQDLQIGIRAAFAHGERFALPLVELPDGEARVFTARHAPATSARVIAALRRDDGGWTLPVHPDELPFTSRRPCGELPDARAAASGRTVHVAVGDVDHALLKLDLAHVPMHRKLRPVSEDEARMSVATFDHVVDAMATRPRADDPLALLPEAAALADGARDAAVVVRDAAPFPPRAADGPTSALPMYSLWAQNPDVDDAPPLLLPLLARARDDDEPPADAVERVFLAPAIAAVCRVMLDAGSALTAHGQNLHLELDAWARPTGRVVLADFEDVWPDPIVCDALGLPCLDDEYQASDRSLPEARIAESFQDYFVWSLLHPLLLCAERCFGEEVRDLRARAHARIGDEVRARGALVDRCASEGPLAWFARTYL